MSIYDGLTTRVTYEWRHVFGHDWDPATQSYRLRLTCRHCHGDPLDPIHLRPSEISNFVFPQAESLKNNFKKRKAQ